MRYFLDCEFNGFGGDLISLALIPISTRFREPLYLVITDFEGSIERWVRRNVIKVLDDVPPGVEVQRFTRAEAAEQLGRYLRSDPSDTIIVADWPDDLTYFCKLLITGPGEMVATRQRIQFEMVRVNSYPTDLEGAVRHNAAWDALALRAKLYGAAE